MNGNSNYSQEDYERFLAWLAPERERAGAKLLEISRRLRKFFMSRGCYDPDLLTEKTVDRVIKTIQPKISTYQGNVEPFFYSVARFIFLENPNPLPPEVDWPEPVVPQKVETPDLLQRLKCCLNELEPDQQELLMQYHDGETLRLAAKRKQLAARLGISQGALRIKVNRLKSLLKTKLKESVRPPDNKDGSVLFGVRDVLDALGLAQKLTAQTDALSGFLYAQFCAHTKRLVGQCLATQQLSEELRLALANDLNIVLKDPSLYAPKRFEKVALTNATKQLLARFLPSDNLLLLNRRLLEDAYPNEIAKMRKAD